MKHKHHKRFIKLLFFTSIIPGSLAAACTENGNNKNSTSSKSSDQASSGSNAKDLNNMQSDQPTETQPVGNDSDLVNQSEKGETQNTPTKFDDVNKLTKSIQVSGDYATHDSQSAWEKLKDNQKLIIQQLQIPQSVTDKYKIKIISDSLTFNNENEGKITNIVAEFKLGNQYQTVRFELTGFKVDQTDQQVPNGKNNFLTQKDVSPDLKQLFPSLLAQMLLFNDQPDQPYPRGDTNTQHYQLDYEHLHNNNSEYFTPKIPQFGRSLKDNFFITNSAEQNRYDYKIDGIKFDDTEGTFSLNVKIFNLEKAPQNEPEIEQQFNFNGFRKIDFDNVNNNVIGFSILPTELTTILQNNKIKTELKALSNTNNSITSQLSQDALNRIKSGIYKKINIYTAGKTGNYNLMPADLTLNDLGGLRNNISIYPFYSRYSSEDIFHDFDVYITNESGKKKIGVQFNIKPPIFVQSNFSTLADFNYVPNPRTLNFHIEKEVNYDQVINQ